MTHFCRLVGLSVSRVPFECESYTIWSLRLCCPFFFKDATNVRVWNAQRHKRQIIGDDQWFLFIRLWMSFNLSPQISFSCERYIVLISQKQFVGTDLNGPFTVARTVVYVTAAESATRNVGAAAARRSSLSTQGTIIPPCRSIHLAAPAIRSFFLI